MKKHMVTACLYTVATAVLLGIAYPLAITVVAHVLFPKQANGDLIRRDGKLIGSQLIGQPFTGAGYFHSRPSAAGTGYDATASSGSNLGPTSKTLIDGIQARTQASAATEHNAAPVPIDLVTASASGLDPDITPAAAMYQAPRVARERHLSEADVDALVQSHIAPRQFSLLGEPRVNVLELNLALDVLAGAR